MKKNGKYLVFCFVFFLFSELFGSENIYFLSLKNKEVNLRQGPSFDFPIKLIYEKKHLPLMILDKYETWRKVKDFENNTGWIHVSQLSKKKSAININDNSLLYKKSTIFSKAIARLEIGRLVLIKKCNKKWCTIDSDTYEGWILKSYLWGRTK